MSPEQLGLPGNRAHAYLAKDAAGAESIVYAVHMAVAVIQYRFINGREPHSIRQMSDNE